VIVIYNVRNNKSAFCWLGVVCFISDNAWYEKYKNLNIVWWCYVKGRVKAPDINFSAVFICGISEVKHHTFLTWYCVDMWGSGVKLHTLLISAAVWGEFHGLASLFPQGTKTQSECCDGKISAPARNQNPAVQLADTHCWVGILTLTKYNLTILCTNSLPLNSVSISTNFTSSWCIHVWSICH
jgi:hypothetical protein